MIIDIDGSLSGRKEMPTMAGGKDQDGEWLDSEERTTRSFLKVKGDSLESGMFLAEPVFADSGQVLYRAGTSVTLDVVVRIARFARKARAGFIRVFKPQRRDTPEPALLEDPTSEGASPPSRKGAGGAAGEVTPRGPVNPGSIEGARGTLRWDIGAERHETRAVVEEVSGTWVRVHPEGQPPSIPNGTSTRLVIRRDVKVPEGLRGLDVDLTYAGPASAGGPPSPDGAAMAVSPADSSSGMVRGSRGSLNFRLGTVSGSERAFSRRRVSVTGPDGDIMMQIKVLDWEYDRNFYNRFVLHSTTDNFNSGDMAVFSMSDNIFNRVKGDIAQISSSLSVNLKATVKDISENGVRLQVARGCMMPPVNQNTALRISMLFPMIGKSRALAMSLYGRAVEIRETDEGDRIFHIAFLRTHWSMTGALDFIAERYSA